MERRSFLKSLAAIVALPVLLIGRKAAFEASNPGSNPGPESTWKGHHNGWTVYDGPYGRMVVANGEYPTLEEQEAMFSRGLI